MHQLSIVEIHGSPTHCLLYVLLVSSSQIGPTRTGKGQEKGMQDDLRHEFKTL